MDKEKFNQLVEIHFQPHLQESAKSDPRIQAFAFLAWEYGHADGLGAVDGYFADMVGAYKNAESKF